MFVFCFVQVVHYTPLPWYEKRRGWRPGLFSEKLEKTTFYKFPLPHRTCAEQVLDDNPLAGRGRGHVPVRPEGIRVCPRCGEHRVLFIVLTLSQPMVFPKSHIDNVHLFSHTRWCFTIQMQAHRFPFHCTNIVCTLLGEWLSLLCDSAAVAVVAGELRDRNLHGSRGFIRRQVCMPPHDKFMSMRCIPVPKRAECDRSPGPEDFGTGMISGLRKWLICISQLRVFDCVVCPCMELSQCSKGYRDMVS